MLEVVRGFLENLGISKELIIFIISAIPILELRGGLIAAAIFGVPVVPAYIICVIGNIIPVPFILLFIKEIFAFMKKYKIFPKVVDYFERKAMKKSDSIQTKQLIGLFAFVAIPLPGTGAWTGSLIAALLGFDIKKSFVSIFFGVLVAGLIMLVISYFVPSLFGFNFNLN